MEQKPAVTIDIKPCVKCKIGISEDEWPKLIKASLLRVLKLAATTQVDCVGCNAAKLAKTIFDMQEAKVFNEHSQGVLEGAIGYYIIHTGSIPEYGDLLINLEEIHKYYSHDHEDGETVH